MQVNTARECLDAQALADLAEAVTCRDELVALWLFGSHARRQATPLSRNLFVRIDWTVDHQRVYDTMAARIATLDRFIRDIAAYLNTPDVPEG